MAQVLTQAAKICIVVTTILGVVAIVAVALRFHCRMRLQKVSPGADDWCMLVALFLSTGIAILTNYVAATTGVGDTAFTPTGDQVIFALKANLGLENSQIACMGLIKISLLLYYKRIFVSRIFKTIADVLIVIIGAFEFSIIMAVLFSKGVPVSAQWDPFVPFKINLSAVLISFCGGNAVLDLATLALPLSAVRSLQMSASRKLVLTVIFTLGSFCIVASIVRLYYAVEYTKVPATGATFFQKPFIYNILWALIEPPVFILAGCLLTLGPLFRSKHGPKNLFQSLKSRLLSMRSSERSTTPYSRTQKAHSQAVALHPGLTAHSEQKLWNTSRTNSSVGEHTGGAPSWELRDVDRSQRSGYDAV